jgi:D-beta-D-heptose 7-phosphate kinase/D-beta-D-heptose 1-phosphate adenosyltransferase
MKNSCLTGKTKITSELFIDALNAFSNCRALVIGDFMVDEYLWGSVERISQEAPVQIVDVSDREYRLGGSGNVVNNLRSLGAEVAVASVTGDGFYRKFLFDELKRLDVSTECLLIDEDRPATQKTRVLASNQQIVRIDIESRKPISMELENQIITFLNKKTMHYDVVLVSDYAKGVITDRMASTAIKNANKYKIPVVIDPKGKDFSKYSGATLITPNVKEASLASNIEIVDETTTQKAARKLLSKTKCNAILITRGKHGMTLIVAKYPKAINIPAQAREVYDVSGAGDTVAAVSALSIGSGLSFEDSSYLANIAGGIVVGKLGASAVTKAELILALNQYQKKSYLTKEKTFIELIQVSENLKKAKKQVVYLFDDFTTLDGNHIELLKQAKLQGDVLIVGINYNKALGGNNGLAKSLIPKRECAKMLSALEFVDHIIIPEKESNIEIIKGLKPGVIIESSKLNFYDHIKKHEKQILKKYGGKIVKLN